MLYFKLITQIIAALAAIAVAILDYFGDDKRTRRYQHYKRATVSLLVVASIGGVITTWADEHDRQEDAKSAEARNSALSAQVIHLRSELAEASRRSQRTAVSESQQLRDLQAKADRLSAELAPFVELAKLRYPSLPASAALVKLHDEIRDLKARAAALEQKSQQVEAQNQEIAQLKDTKPEVRAELALERGQFYTLITVDNNVPIQASWVVVTKNNIILGDIMLGEEEIYPTSTRHAWKYRTNIQQDKIADGYLELRFRYHSLYWAEMGKPGRLKGEITKAYSLTGGSLLPRAHDGA